MGLETGSYISDLNTANPTATDAVSQADDHIRLIKTALKNSFPKDLRGVSEPRVGDTLRYNGTSFANDLLPRLFHTPMIGNRSVIAGNSADIKCSTNSAVVNTIGYTPVSPYIAMLAPEDDLVCMGFYHLVLALSGTPSAFDYVEVYLYNGNLGEDLTRRSIFGLSGTPYSGTELSHSGVLVPHLANCANLEAGHGVIIYVTYYAHATSIVTNVSIDSSKSFLSLQDMR